MLFDGSKLLFIAGPSLLESTKVAFAVADRLKAIQEAHPELKVIFKGSFDKANRTSLYSARGNGLEEGLALLSEVKDRTGLPVMTDVHERYQVEPASMVCDAIQIPSLLSRQTDLLVEAAKSGRAVHVKKGPFLAPHEVLSIVEKLEASHASEVFITERGSNFGYHNLVVDMRVFTSLRRAEAPLLIDATINSPLPGTDRNFMEYQYALPMAKAALAAGADGVYLDTHPNPVEALVNPSSHLPLEQLTRFAQECLRVWKGERESKHLV